VRNWLLWAALAAPIIFGQFSFDFGGLGDLLAAELQAEILALVESIIFVWNVLVQVANGLATGLSFTYSGGLGIFKSIFDFFKWVWEAVILKAVAYLLKELADLKQWLNDHFQTLKDILAAIKRAHDLFYKNILRPLLNVIIRMRRFLALLRLFHIHVLDRLDRFLGGLEAKLLGNFFFLRGWANRLLVYIEFFLNAQGYIRRVVFLNSAAQALDGLFRMITGTGVAYWTGGGPVAASGDPMPVSPDDLAPLYAQALETDTGYFADTRAQVQAWWTG
jgi:hypothetical protein